MAIGDQTINEAIEGRDTAVTLAKEILARLQKLNRIKEDDLNDSPVAPKWADLACYVTEVVSGHSPNMESRYFEKIVQKIDTCYWRSLMNRSKFVVLMNTDAKRNMDNKLKESPPPFTAEMIYSELRGYSDNRMMTFIGGVICLFQTLSSDFRSNDKVCFKRRIILDEAISGGYWSKYRRANDHISDLERIFLLVDQKDPTVFNEKELSAARIIQSIQAGENTITLPYFRCNIYQNGNIHVWFTREDLVDQLNTIIERHYGASLGVRTSKRAS